MTAQKLLHFSPQHSTVLGLGLGDSLLPCVVEDGGGAHESQSRPQLQEGERLEPEGRPQYLRDDRLLQPKRLQDHRRAATVCQCDGSQRARDPTT